MFLLSTILAGCGAPCADGFVETAPGVCDPATDAVPDDGGETGGETGGTGLPSGHPGVHPGSGPDSLPAVEGPPDLVLVFLDTLRADHADLPALAEVRAASAAGTMLTETWTVASVYEYLTGVDGTTLGAASWPSGQAVLDPQVVTLADRVGAAGYYTVALSQNAQFGASSGTTDSFDVARLGPQGDPDRLETMLDESLNRADPDQPVLLVVSLASAHDPYAEPRAVDAQDAAAAIAASTCPVDFREIGALPELQRQLASGAMPVDGPVAADCADLAHLLYGFDAASADEQLARLLTALEERGLLDADDVLVVTGDHGEALGEADADGLVRYAHGYSPTAAVTDGFVYARGPGFAPGSALPGRKTPADIGATLLAAAGLAEEGPVAEGTAGRPLAVDTSDRVATTFFCGLDDAQPGQPFLRVLKLALGDAAVVLRRDGGDTVSVQAFDLLDDPGEQHDLARGVAGEDLPEPYATLDAYGRVELERLAAERYCAG